MRINRLAAKGGLAAVLSGLILLQAGGCFVQTLLDSVQFETGNVFSLIVYDWTQRLVENVLNY